MGTGMPVGAQGIPLLSLTNTDEGERQAFQLAMAKVNQTHTNLAKVNLKIIQAVGEIPKGAAHTEMINKLQAYKSDIEGLTAKYEATVQYKRIPDLAEATTSHNLKKNVCDNFERASPKTPHTSHI